MLSKLFKRRAKHVPDKPEKPQWFDSRMLNSTFDQLQAAVAETTLLAADISSQLENRLQTTEKQLSTILFVVTEGIIIVDYRGIIQEWNTGAEIIFGYTRAEVVGQHICTIASTDQSDEIKSRFAATHVTPEGNTSRIRPLHCTTKKGDTVLVEISINAFPSENSNGRPNIIAIVRDVTEQTQIREDREKERKLLAAVMDATQDLIIIKDPDGRWIRANKAACHIYGFTREEDYLNRTDAEILEDFPELATAFEECGRTDAQAWRGHRTSRSEEVLIDQQGLRQFFDVLKTPIYEDAKTREMLVVSARNISALREKREQINVAYKALNASSDIIVITDRDGCILFANKMFLIKYRFVDMRDVIGRRMNVVKSDKTTSAQHADMWSTITAGKQWEGTVTNQDAMGKYLTVQSTILPIVDTNLDTPYYICVQKCIDC